MSIFIMHLLAYLEKYFIGILHGRKKENILTAHLTHFIYGNMAS